MTANERSTWVVPANTWHARLYRQWRKFGNLKNPLVTNYEGEPTYRENLCHYWRVVFFWAPLNLLGWYLFSSRSFSSGCEDRVYYGEHPRRNRMAESRVPRYIIAFGASIVTWFLTLAFMNEAALVVFAWLVGVPLALLLCIAVGTAFESAKDFVRDWLWDRRAQKGTSRNDEKRTSLTVEYLRARKAKICPYIEIENTNG